MERGIVVASMWGGSFVKVRSGSVISTVEMIGDEGALQVGDSVWGCWTALGGEIIWRGSDAFSVVIQDH